jgi:hypothetical protein
MCVSLCSLHSDVTEYFHESFLDGFHSVYPFISTKNNITRGDAIIGTMEGH